LKLKRLDILVLSIFALICLVFIITACNKGNANPSCTVTYPKNNEKIPHGTQVNIIVEAYDSDGMVTGVNYFIDGKSIGISNLSPHSYFWNTLEEITGIHLIKVTATDDKGSSISKEISVYLTEGVPQSEFTAYQISVSPDSSVLFYSRSINNPLSWKWDFGDGNSSTLQNPVHVYTTAGSYTVSLTITNSYGSDTETKNDYITVTDPISDYDGNIYQTVKIGNQIWMKENLKSTHYADGTAMVNGTGVGDIFNDSFTKYYFAYNDNEDFVPIYGRLYTWAAVINGESVEQTTSTRVQGVCPDGWHVPDDAEWKKLERYLGMTDRESDLTGWRGTNEGLMLRETGTSHWFDYTDYIPGTNTSGFTALPAGSRSYNGSFNDLMRRANFWSATENIGSFAWCRRMYYNGSEVFRYDDIKTRAYSVRCVKD